MDNSLFVHAVFHFTSFGFFDGLFNVGGDGAGLGVRHQTLGTEQAGVFTEFWHISRGGNQDIKVNLTFLQALQELFVFSDVGTSRGGFLGLVQRGKNGDPDGLAVAVRQDDGGTDILVGLAWVRSDWS